MGHLWGRGYWWKVYLLHLMKVPHPQPLTRVQHFSMRPKGYTKQPGQQIKPMTTHFCCLVWGTKVYQVPPSFRKPSQDPVDFLSSTFTDRLVLSRMSHFFTIKYPLQFLLDPLRCLEDTFIDQVNYLKTFVHFCESKHRKCQSNLLLHGNNQQAQSELTGVIHCTFK